MVLLLPSAGHSQGAGPADAIIPYAGLLTYSSEHGPLPAGLVGIAVGLSVVSTAERVELSIIDSNVLRWGSAGYRFSVGAGGALRIGGSGEQGTAIGVGLAYGWIPDGIDQPMAVLQLLNGQWQGVGMRVQLRVEQSLRALDGTLVLVMIGRRSR